MAVFMLNECKYDACGRIFPNLGDLIHHIEDQHIDYDPLVVEQKEASQPSCLPLSYVLRFFNEPSKKECPPSINSDVRRKLASIVKIPSVRSVTPTGSELDDEDMVSGQSEDSNDSWTTVEEFSAEFILKYGIRNNVISTSGQGNGKNDKPFACPVPGCKKRYKNVNGIKYHSKNGHKKEGKIKKGYKCRCGKSYKTAQGLKNHSITHYPSQPSSPHSLKVLSPPVMKALQSYVAASQNNSIKHSSQIMDLIDHGKTMKSVLECSANKLAVSTLTMPRHANIQMAMPGVPIVNHYETELKIETPSLSPAKASHYNTLIESGLLHSNALGILTPAASPISTANEKLIRLSKDEAIIASMNQIRSNLALSPPMEMQPMPLTPTPSIDDSHNNFIVPNNILMH